MKKHVSDVLSGCGPAFMFPSCISSALISSTDTPLASRKFRQAWAVDSQLGVMWGKLN